MERTTTDSELGRKVREADEDATVVAVTSGNGSWAVVCAACDQSWVGMDTVEAALDTVEWHHGRPSELGSAVPSGCPVLKTGVYAEDGES